MTTTMTITNSLPDVDALCVRAEAACRAVAARDLAGVPLYIVPQSRLPDHLGGRSVCNGFTTPSLDLYLQDVIGPAWRGRGPCMVINDVGDQPLGRSVRQAALPWGDRRSAENGSDELVGHCVPQVAADDLELDFLRIVLHELAHILQRPELYRDRHGTESARIAFEALVLGDCVASEPASEPDPRPFSGHEADFIRIALHLRHRAEMAGVLVPLFGYCAGTPYGLSHANRYRQALGNEPRRLAGERFRDILATPYPKAFWRLWTTDVARWLSVCSPELERSCT